MRTDTAANSSKKEVQFDFGVIANIAFPLSSKKGKFKSPPSPEVEFTRTLAVAQGLLSIEDHQSVPRLSHPSRIELIFG